MRRVPKSDGGRISRSRPSVGRRSSMGHRTKIRRRGSELSADDLRTWRGVVLGRAVSTLRSVETQPSAWGFVLSVRRDPITSTKRRARARSLSCGAVVGRVRLARRADASSDGVASRAGVRALVLPRRRSPEAREHVVRASDRTLSKSGRVFGSTGAAVFSWRPSMPSTAGATRSCVR